MTENFEHKTLIHQGRTIAYRQDGDLLAKKGVFFLPGYYSDMQGTKASFLAERCAKNGMGCTRLDYSGHGLSSGTFTDGCISDWFADALAVFDETTKGTQIVVGSSMGGWMMLLLAQARPARVAGLVGIAAAPDFTQDLVWDKLSPAQQKEMQDKGVIYEPSDYGAPLPYTLKLVEDGRKNLLLTAPIPYTGPVRLLQGMMDTDVPWQTAPRIAQALAGADVRVTLVKDGDHPLSREQDLEMLWNAVQEVAGK